MVAQISTVTLRIMTYEYFSKWVKQERENRGWSQTQLATYSNISLRTIQHIEKGENTKLDIFFKVTQALDKKVVIGD